MAYAAMVEPERRAAVREVVEMDHHLRSNSRSQRQDYQQGDLDAKTLGDHGVTIRGWPCVASQRHAGAHGVQEEVDWMGLNQQPTASVKSKMIVVAHVPPDQT
jgi:hypothetical protein